MTKEERIKAAEEAYPYHDSGHQIILRAAFIKGAEAEAESKWIVFDRNDKSPLDYKEVLIHEDLSLFGRENRIIQARVHFSENGQSFGGPYSLTGRGVQKGVFFSVPAILNSDYITHWQPLPQPPLNQR